MVLVEEWEEALQGCSDDDVPPAEPASSKRVSLPGVRHNVSSNPESSASAGVEVSAPSDAETHTGGGGRSARMNIDR